MISNRFLQVLCCVALATALVACDDGETKPAPEDTSVADGTSADSTPDATNTETTTTPDVIDDTPCCTEPECAAQGKTCSATTCACEAITSDDCQSVDQVCDPALAQSAAWVCVDDGNGSGACRVSCTTAGGTDTCPTGSLCITEVGDAGYCEGSQCSGFFADDCTGTDEKCIPVGNGTNFCYPNGLGAVDTACTGLTDCGAGLLCVGGFCTAADCSALTNAQPCTGTDEQCSGWTIGDEPADLGTCIFVCDPWAASSGCAANEVCFPDMYTVGDGQCTPATPANTAQLGATCDNNTPATTCADGLLCIGGECMTLCDPNAAAGGPGSCGATEECGGLFITDDNGTPADTSDDTQIEIAFGSCQPAPVPCDAFTTSTACQATEWCMPDTRDAATGAMTGICAPTGTVNAGESCTAANCSDGNVCIGTGDNTAECFPACDPQSATTNLGACADSTDLCQTLTYTSGGDTDWGICYATCTPWTTPSGCDAAQWCAPEARATDGTWTGLCYDNGTGTVAEGDSCQTAECAAGSVCVGTSDTTSDCRTFCDPKATSGAGTCADSTRICDGFLADADWGLCSPGVAGAPLAEFATCPAGTEYEMCASTAMCLDLPGFTEGLQCIELCKTANGAFGTTNHPDCTRPTATCVQKFQTPTFGLCQ